MAFRLRCFFLALLLGSFQVWADGPRDNDPETVRPVPRPGIEVSDEQAASLKEGLSALARQIARLETSLPPAQKALIPDVEIYFRAVRDNLDHGEFFAPADVEKALRLLETGQKRASQLALGVAPWTSQTGLVVRGFRSRLDDTVQPYGLVIPETYQPQGELPSRVDIWFHGRGETLSETNFIDQRSRQVGQYAPARTIVLHPYGRYSNAFKFAGEVDVLEALEHVKEQYRVDESRVSVRGFSMGGAACWQFAVHYADRWFAANPGAGFSETPEFLRFFQKEELNPSASQRKLWRWYDCPDYAVNLLHCPTVAYSGEDDIQKQAADIMEAALKNHGIRMVHVIGPKTGHRIHPQSKVEIEDRMNDLARAGNDLTPFVMDVHLVTYTLKYNRMHWLTIDRMGQHWERTRVDAKIRGSAMDVLAENATQLTFRLPAGQRLLRVNDPVEVRIGEDRLEAPSPLSDRSWQFTIHLVDGHWHAGPQPTGGLAKKHGLQGPIDDALMSRFLFVMPSNKDPNPLVDQWVRSEAQRAVEHWRKHFRGHVRVKQDSDVNEQDVADSNLILWGSPAMNSWVARVADTIPIQWTKKSIQAGDVSLPAESHALIAVYPNPENGDRYIVLNSSFTYREYAYLNNARQVPMLPDWAIVDLNTPAGTQYPGKIVLENFFDENWQLK